MQSSSHSGRARRRPSSAPHQGQSRVKGRRVLEGRTFATIDAAAEEGLDGSDKDVELITPQGGARRRVKFVEGAAVAPFAPRGSAQAAARFARQQCQHRLHIATTLRRGDRLSPRSPRCFRPASAQAHFRRAANGQMQIAYASTAQVLASARRLSWEEEAEFAQQEALTAQANEEEEEEMEQTRKEVSKETGTQGLKEHVKHIWLMYQEQEAGKDERDRALLLALKPPDEEDKELALQNEMKLLKTGEDAIAFFAKHGDQSDLQVIFCNPAPEEEGKYNPYDLVVVDEQDRGNEYFMISPKGIVHVCPGKQSEHISLTAWMHQVMVFTVLVSMAFFRNYLTGRAFSKWRSGAAKQIFATHRQRLSQRLFLAKPIFVEAQVKVHGILRSMSFVRLLHFDTSQRGGIELRPFLTHQRELCERADLDSTAESAREVVDATIKELMKSMDEVNPQALLLKKMRTGKMSVYIERQEAEREAYLRRLCEFNRSLIGQFIRVVDVMQQSCLVDLAVSKARSLYERLERTPKLFQVSAAFEIKSEGARKAGSSKVSAPMILTPSKQDFINGLEKVLEHLLAAVNQVAPVASYRKYSRHLRTDSAAVLAGNVVTQDRIFRAAQRDLIQQVNTDFDKAQQFCESYFAPLYDIYLHQQKWDPDAFEKSQLTHEQLAEGMTEMQTFDKHLEKLKTNHASGFLNIEARSLKASLVPHVETGLQFLKAKLRALASKTCKYAVERFTEVNHKLQERPKTLDQLVEYVHSFKRVEAALTDLEILKTSVEEMYATLFQHGVRTDMAEDLSRDMLHQRATNFENTILPAAQFFVNDQGDNACTEVSNRFSVVENECEDLETEITTGMAADPSHLSDATRVLEYLDEVHHRLEEIGKSFKYLNDCYTLFMQDPQDVDILEEAQQVLKERCHLWEVALQWTDLQESVAAMPLQELDVHQLRCRLQGFIEVLGHMSMDMPGDGVVLELASTVEAWMVQRMPMYIQLTNPVWSDKNLLQAFGMPGMDASGIKVGNLELVFNTGPAGDRVRKYVAENCLQAAAEHCLNATLACVVEAWERMEMSLTQPRSPEAPALLGDQTEILTRIQEDITSLDQVLKSPSITDDIREHAQEAHERLSSANDVLEELLALQERYILVEPLFRIKVLETDEVVGSQAVEKFAGSDETFRLLMHRAATSLRIVLNFASQPGLSKMLGRIAEGLSLAERGMTNILDYQRRLAPRLWFLSDTLLVRALVAAQDVPAGERSASKTKSSIDRTLTKSYTQLPNEKPLEDEAAGNAFAAYAPWLFPWISKASAQLERAALMPVPDPRSGSKEVQRQSTAGDVARQELDRVLTANRASDSTTFNPLGAGIRPSEGHPQVQTTDWKSALLAESPGDASLGQGQARGRLELGSKSLSRGLSSLLDGIADSLEQGAAGDSSGVLRPEWSRMVVLHPEDGDALTLRPRSCPTPRGVLFGDWVLKTEKTMQMSMGQMIKEALREVAATSPTESLSARLSGDPGTAPPGQALFVALGIYFAFSVEAALSGESGAPPLSEVSQWQLELRQHLSRLLRQPSLQRTQRTLASAILLQAIHWHEALEALECVAQYAQGDRLQESFEWKRQFQHRYDLTTGEVQLSCMDWSFRYGYEYVGCTPRLVRTPQSERCFLTFAAAMRQQSFAICGLSGPTGCGKSELVRELASMAAVPLLEATPAQMDLPAVQQILAGVAATNAWSFLRFPESGSEALSKLAVLATSLRELQLALRSEVKELTLGSCQVKPASVNAALFLAMPYMQHQHALEVPSSAFIPAALARLIRPLALVRAPAQRMMSALLYLEGFEQQEASRLASKLLAVAINAAYTRSARTPGQDVQEHSLRQLRAAARAAGDALRKGACSAAILLASLGIFAPGEGSLEQRLREGPSGNPVLQTQTSLLCSVCEEEAGLKLVAGDHSQLLLVKDPTVDIGLGQEVDNYLEQACLSKGMPASTAEDSQSPSRLSLVASEILQHAHAGSATVLLGPACSGKTTLLKALHTAANLLPESAEDAQEGSDDEEPTDKPRKPALYVWQVYPGVMPLEQLFGSKGKKQQGVLPEILNKIAEGSSRGKEEANGQNAELGRMDVQRKRIDLVVFDGEVESDWVDRIWPVVSSRRLATHESGYAALPPSTELLFETRSLANATPAFCAHCAICPIEGLLDVEHQLQAFQQRLLSGAAGRCARIHAPALMAWLARLASGIRNDLGSDSSLMWAGEVVAADQLLKLLEATLQAAMPMMDMLPDAHESKAVPGEYEESSHANEEEELSQDLATLIELWALWATAWALGGHLAGHQRKRLGEWLLLTMQGQRGLPYALAALGTTAQDPENFWKLRILSNVAGTSGVPDVNCETKIKLISELMVDDEEASPAQGHIIVPTEETEAICNFVRHKVYADVHFGIRIFGAPQSGKSALAEVLTRSDTVMLGRKPELFRCPHAATPAFLDNFLKAKLPRHQGRARIVIDDVHMASKSLQERLRQVAESGSLSTGAMQRAGVACRGSQLMFDAVSNTLRADVGGRWLRHFLAIRLPAPQGKSLMDICTRLVLRWSKSIPSEEARMLLISQSMPEKLVQLLPKVAEAFPSTPQRMFPVLPLLDVSRWFQRLMQSVDLVTSTAALKQVVWYEGTQQLGGRLQHPEDQAKLQQLFEDAGIYRPKDENGPKYVALNKGTAEAWDQAEAKSQLKRIAEMGSLSMPLACYEDMIGVVLATARALQLASPSQAAGALVLGPPGSGRKTGAKLAGFLSGTQLHPPVAVDHAGLREELASIQDTLRSRSGSRAFGPLTEDTLLHGDCHEFLEDIDNILRQATRFEARRPSTSKLARRSSRSSLNVARADSRAEGALTAGQGLSEALPTGASLAFLLILSPTLAADWFRSQVRKYPGLISIMTLVFVHPFGQEAYLEVAKEVLLPSSAGQDGEEVFSTYQEEELQLLQSTAEVAARMPSALQLPGALQRSHMPGAALFVATVKELKHLVEVKEAQLHKETVALENAATTLAHFSKCASDFRSQFSTELDQARQAEEDVVRFTAELEDLQKRVKEGEIAAEHLNDRMSQTKDEIQKFEQEVAETMADARQELTMATLDLRAVPQAVAEEFAAADPPPERVQLVFFVLLIALDLEESWENVVQLLSEDFAQRLQDLELDDMTEKTALICQRLDRLEELGGLSKQDEDFLVKAARSWSTAFIAAVNQYREVTNEVAEIRRLEDHLQQLTDEQDEAQEAAEALVDQIQETEIKITTRKSANDKARRKIGRSADEVQGLNRLDRLLSSPQVEAWQARPGEIAVELSELHGRLLLGCFLAHYSGYLNPQGPVLQTWRQLCLDHRLLEPGQEGGNMPETKLLHLVSREQDGHGLRPLQPSLAAARISGPVPLLVDPFGVARAFLSAHLQAEDSAVPEELEVTSVLGGTFAAARAQASTDAKPPPSLFVLLGEEFCGSSSQIPKTLPPGLLKWLNEQKEFAPGKLVLLSDGTTPPAASEMACSVLDFGSSAGEALEDCFLEEVVRVIEPELYTDLVKARQLLEFERSMVAESHAKLLAEVGLSEKASSEDVFALLPFVDEIVEMQNTTITFERQHETATKGLSEVETRMNAWRQPVRVALALLQVASATEKWHPGYHAEVHRCTKWLWHFFSQHAGQTPDAMAAEMASAWLMSSAPRFFHRHHSCLAVCTALACFREVQRKDAVSGALCDALSFAAAELAGKQALPVAVRDEETDGGLTPDFVTPRGWKVLQAAREKMPALAEAESSLLENPERWIQAIDSGQETLPVSLGPLPDLIVLCSVAPQLVPARLQQVAVRELGSAGSHLLLGTNVAGYGPAERIRQAVYDSAGVGRGPPPVLIFLTEEEVDAEHRSTVELTLASCAADAGVKLEAMSFTSAGLGTQVTRTFHRVQKAHSGWLLLLDAADARLTSIMPKDPQLLRSLHGMLRLVQASVQVKGQVVGPSVLIALQVHHRPGQSLGLPALRHLFGPDGSRVCVSCPRGLRASLLATAADMDECRDLQDPDREVLMANLVCFHVLLQHRARCGAARRGGGISLVDLAFATEALSPCLLPGQPWQEPTRAILQATYGSRLADDTVVEALTQEFASFSGPADFLEEILPPDLWEQLADRVTIGELQGFLEVVLENNRPGTVREESMLQAFLGMSDSTLVQSTSPDLHFRMRPTSSCLLEAVVCGLDGSSEPAETSEAKVHKRLKEVKAELEKYLKDLWPVDDAHQQDSVGWQTLLRELQRYNVWQQRVGQSLRQAENVLNLMEPERTASEALCRSLWLEEVPEVWCQAAGGMLDCAGLPLTSWLYEARGRYSYLDDWSTECVPRVSHWFGGLFCPGDLLTSLQRHAAEKRSLPLDSLTLVVAKYGGPSGYVAPAEPWNLQAILEQPGGATEGQRVFSRVLTSDSLQRALMAEDVEGGVDGVEGPLPPSACFLLHGLYLTGCHWSNGLTADPGPEPNQWLPLLRLLPLTVEEFSRHRKLEDGTAASPGRQKYYSCPVYRHGRRSERPMLTLDVPSSEDADRWAKAGAALLCELPGRG